MDVGSVTESAQISWRQVAVQKQERLKTGAEGTPVREMVETIMPTIYTKEGSRIEGQALAPSRRVTISV